MGPCNPLIMDNRKSFEKILIMLHLEGTNSTRNVQETRNRKNGKKKLEARKSRWSALSLPVYRFLFFVIFFFFLPLSRLGGRKIFSSVPFHLVHPPNGRRRNWPTGTVEQKKLNLLVGFRPERRGVHLIDNKRPRKGGNCHQRRLNISPEHFTLRCSTNLIIFCFFQFGWLSAAIGFKCSHTSFFSHYSWLEVDYP